VTLEELERVRDAARVVTSVDKPVGEEGEATLGELLPGEETPPEEQVNLTLREDAVRRAVEGLPTPEREVVKLRYGINGDEPTTLEEVSRRLDLTAHRIRELEAKALDRLGRMREVEALRKAA